MGLWNDHKKCNENQRMFKDAKKMILSYPPLLFLPTHAHTKLKESNAVSVANRIMDEKRSQKALKGARKILKELWNHCCRQLTELQVLTKKDQKCWLDTFVLSLQGSWRVYLSHLTSVQEQNISLCNKGRSEAAPAKIKLSQKQLY